jgi:hypothetical protein
MEAKAFSFTQTQEPTASRWCSQHCLSRAVCSAWPGRALFSSRDGDRRFFSGLVSVALGVYLLATWRTAGAYFIGIAIGVDLILDDASLVGLLEHSQFARSSDQGGVTSHCIAMFTQRCLPAEGPLS